jgi:CRISPR system Cascade subunit CasE
MYLSRLTLVPGALADQDLIRAFESPYRLHQALWEVFSDSPGRRRDFLYRLDLDARLPRVYALSVREPRPGNGHWRIEPKPFRPQVREGDRLAFALRANPVVTRNGKRHDVVMDAKRRLDEREVPRETWSPQAQLVQEHGAAWLERREGTLGAALEAGSVRVDRYQIHRFPKPSGSRVQLATCDFEGILRVTDPQRLLAAIESGIGPAKGFGCGLMLIRRRPA